MTDSITPPPELVQQWYNAIDDSSTSWSRQLIIRAAQWGADQELEACCEWTQGYAECGDSLRAARRPKPPSLKEQALAALGEMSIEPCLINGVDANAAVRAKYNTIRRALEALPE
jgi:hypothetical protein